MLSAFHAQKEIACWNLGGAASPLDAACTRRVSARPAWGEVAKQIQSDSARADSPVRLLHAQPASPVSTTRYVKILQNSAVPRVSTFSRSCL